MNEKPYSRRAASALVLSSDPLGAALVGAAIELVGYRPAFALADEPLNATLMRVKPTHVVVDGRDAAWRDESALGPVLMLGARLYFFGTAANAAALRATSAAYQARFIQLPEDMARLAEILSRRPSPTPREAPAR